MVFVYFAFWGLQEEFSTLPCSVNGQKVTGQKVTKLLGQKVTIYFFYPGGQKVTICIH